MSQAGIISESGGPFPPPVIFQWIDESTSFNAMAGTGYFCTAYLTATLPAAPLQGTTIAFYVDYQPSAESSFKIQTSGTQQILVGINESSAGGYATTINEGAVLFLVYRTADNTWHETSVQGSWPLF